jgi:hypothetical protein
MPASIRRLPKAMTDPTPIAFELQARFDDGEAWITLAVCATRPTAERSGLRRDVWGRVPTDTRVVPVLPRGSRA